MNSMIQRDTIKDQELINKSRDNVKLRCETSLYGFNVLCVDFESIDG